MEQRRQIRVALAGVGNCAQALLHGIEYYRVHPDDTRTLMNVELGGYRVTDIVVHGARDRRPLRLARNVADHLPNARFALFEDCRHDPALERPDLPKEELRTFLGDLER